MDTVVRPPGPGSSLGSFRAEFIRDPVEVLATFRRRYGDLVYFRVGLRDHYLVAHPDLVREILVKQHPSMHKDPQFQDAHEVLGDGLIFVEDDVHRRHRRLIQPAFERRRMLPNRAIAVDEARAVASTFRQGEVRDISADMGAVALGVATRALFGTNIDPALRPKIRTFSQNLVEGWTNRTRVRRAGLGSEAFRDNLAFGSELIDAFIADARTAPPGRTDLLAALVAAVDEDGSRFTDDEAREELIQLLITGHETTAHALSWAWYLLGQNPDVADEIADVARPDDSSDEGPELVERVVNEILRLMPPIPTIPREAVEDVEVGGYVIPRGSVVIVSPWVLHHDERWFPEPERFDPGRWSPERRESIPRFAYVPFASGPRSCVGQPLAMVEARAVLETIASEWRLRLDPTHVVERVATAALRPADGVRVIPERRS